MIKKYVLLLIIASLCLMGCGRIGKNENIQIQIINVVRSSTIEEVNNILENNGIHKLCGYPESPFLIVTAELKNISGITQEYLGLGNRLNSFVTDSENNIYQKAQWGCGDDFLIENGIEATILPNHTLQGIFVYTVPLSAKGLHLRATEGYDGLIETNIPLGE